MKVGGKLFASLCFLLLCTPGLNAQVATGTVTGRVYDGSTQQPIADAIVTAAQRTVVTDANGRFMLPGMTEGTHRIRVARLGYGEETRTAVVVRGETAVVDVVLMPAAIALEGVVAIGYGTRRAADVTGAVAVVGEADFNTGRVISVEQLIQGKIAGVRIVDTGEPGGGVQVRIRGGTSVNASNDPLFVLDGLPLPVGGGLSAGRNPLNFLKPDDIKSITVLKDAAATAIYGSRGANGVVLIETRSGSLVDPQLTYGTSVSTSRIVRRADMLTTSQFRAAVAQHASNVTQFLGTADTNWSDAVLRSGFGQEHTVSLAGVSSDMGYRFSAGYLAQEGIVRGSKMDRASAALSYNHRLLDDRLNVRANLRGARTEDQFTPGGGLGAAIIFDPTQPIQTSTGYFEHRNFQLAPNNPVAELAYGVSEGTTFRGIGNVEAAYRLPRLEEITATLRVGADVANSERRTFWPRTLWGQEKRQDLAGYVSRSNPREQTGVLDAFATWARLLDGLQSNVDVTAGYSYETFRGDYPFFEASGLDSDLLGPSGLPVAREVTPFLNVAESRLASFFARGNWSLQNRYLLSVSVRRDGSSKFSPENQWATFPSAAVAWRISEESFMPDLGWLTDLKLRASWGMNGNQSIGNYLWAASYRYSDSFSRAQFGDEYVTTIRPSAVDPNIKWEETTSYNVGLDYTALGHRLSGSIEYYLKDTDDLLFRVPVAAGTYVSNFVTTNIGSVRNQGVELSLNAQLLEPARRGLTWTAGFTAAHNSNRLLTVNPFGGGGEQVLTGGIAGGVGGQIQVLQPGFPVNSFFVFEHRRDSQGRPVATGSDVAMYVDRNNDGEITLADRRPLHSPDPTWVFGHTSTLGWRDLSLGFTLRGLVGNYVYNNLASFSGYYNRLLEAAGPMNLHASVLKNEFVTPQFYSDVYVEDASFLRMDNITLGYTVPSNRFARQVHLYGTIQNVFTLTGYSGVDPESGLLGIDNNLYPRSRTFTTGVSVGF
jgi:TonB-dependent starch-binding outer membrane protein SusC